MWSISWIFSSLVTIEPFLLLQRLINLNVNTDIVLWIRNILRDRRQRVGVNGHCPKSLYWILGHPKVVYVCPCLFWIYTDHIRKTNRKQRWLLAFNKTNQNTQEVTNERFLTWTRYNNANVQYAFTKAIDGQTDIKHDIEEILRFLRFVSDHAKRCNLLFFLTY